MLRNVVFWLTFFKHVTFTCSDATTLSEATVTILHNVFSLGSRGREG